MAYEGPLWPLVVVAAFLVWLTAAAGPVGLIAFLLRFAVALLAIVLIVRAVSWVSRSVAGDRV